jgi:hypothetical protein
MLVSGDMNFGEAVIDGFVQRPVVISNLATPPAADLNYVTSAGTGFSIPGAAGPLAAGSLDTLLVTMDTVAFGNRAGNVIITGNDPANAADTLAATGTVLKHAQPSLDNVMSILNKPMSLGGHPQGGFADSTFAFYNYLYNSTQAQLQDYSYTFTGADSAHFSLVGFTPQTIGGTPGTVTLHFNDANVTPFTAYQATLTLQTRDDPTLPGSTNLADLSWSIFALVTDVSTDSPLVARRTQLHANVPNPFNPMTTIAFELATAERVQLIVFDSRGRRVRSLVQDLLPAGPHRVVWDGRDQQGRDMASGMYFYRMRTPQFEKTHRMTLIR